MQRIGSFWQLKVVPPRDWSFDVFGPKCRLYVYNYTTKIFRKNCRKIHNFWATEKFFIYFWGSTKFPIQWWGFYVSKKGDRGWRPLLPLYPALKLNYFHQNNLSLKASCDCPTYFYKLAMNLIWQIVSLGKINFIFHIF